MPRAVDRVFVLLGALGLLGAGAMGCLRIEQEIETVRRERRSLRWPEISGPAAQASPPAAARRHATRLVAGAEGESHLFSPPPLARDATGRWVAADSLADTDSVSPAPTLSLVAVRPVPVAVQLIGCFAHARGRVAAFALTDRTQPLVGRPGELLEDSDWLLLSLDGEGARTSAQVRNLLTGEEVTLEASRWSFTDQWEAEIAFAEPARRVAVRLRIGDEHAAAGAVYRLVRVAAAPPEALLSVSRDDGGEPTAVLLSPVPPRPVARAAGRPALRGAVAVNFPVKP